MLDLLKKARECTHMGDMENYIDDAIAMVEGGDMREYSMWNDEIELTVGTGRPCLVIPLPVVPVVTEYDMALAKRAVAAWRMSGLDEVAGHKNAALAIAKKRAELDK